MAVRIIPAKKNITVEEEVKKLRVAAYCRVSTDLGDQESSYETQIRHYSHYIEDHPGWESAGIFADEGITGTSTKNRLQFQKMMQQARDGQIDMIVTKSISRFARNTLDCLSYIRELKSLGIPVLFEKENINTMDAKGEVLITVMASLAQQESESISQNVKLGIRYRYQQGIVMVNHSWLLGYTKEKGGKLQIVPEEAKLVKRIFREFMEGANYHEIARGLKEDGFKSPAGKENWSINCIKAILSNEKYIGDALLQKTYIKDCLTHKLVKNRGELPQYYVENDHPAIIPKDLFYLVQGEKQRRKALYQKGGRRAVYYGKYALSGKVLCSHCQSSYKRFAKKGSDQVRWKCRGRIAKICAADLIDESELKEMAAQAISLLDPKALDQLCKDNEARIREISGTIDDYTNQINKLRQELQPLLPEDAVMTNDSRIKKLENLWQERLKVNIQRAELMWVIIQSRQLLTILSQSSCQEDARQQPSQDHDQTVDPSVSHDVGQTVRQPRSTPYDEQVVRRNIEQILVEQISPGHPDQSSAPSESHHPCRNYTVVFKNGMKVTLTKQIL